MRFLIDENLPRAVGHLLCQYGHEAIDIRAIGLRGANDADIAAYARKQRLCLISGDIGFGDIRNYPPGEYFGLLILRLPAKATSVTILPLLKSFLMQSKIVDRLSGKLAVIELGRVRIRKN
jgi:predicted nuclease of predicted toxin-antitoxin system